ncbi:MAG: rod shape-determining protein RodA [Candidatus Magasanikbacteria bacterium CG11_big_fil_rev_8_21_14_0_20_39_34]|uniref:Rod shape-determining protein RodA n=1 Tax=Candidatus Magasanikbacteria bacterium CG11_big_fil_rev_8_21_14_0_20_39_34 TaxID=1974653 RepID=A0A2H0N699_9BACT|nr:MAG: rod shape-determining protein RodA [Candidatus Magasanikbacteria bacterium CG11_big_fil_rev_8_21_14_0_20_39_34]
MWNKLLVFARKFDWIMFLVVCILSIIGLLAVYSIDISRADKLTFFPTQALSIGIGVILVFVGGSLHKTFYESYAKYFYIIAVLALVAVLFFGVDIRGTRGWFRFFGFSFQPAELAKFALIIFLSYWISRQRRRHDTWVFVIYSGLLMAVCAGLVLLQPDLGSAVVLSGIWFGLLIFSRVPKKKMLLLIGGVLLIFLVAWFFLFKEYQKERFFTFLYPDRDPLGSGYNITQSIIAIGSGKGFGRGLGFGSQSQLHFLPEAQSDFIFSVIGEELGFFGAAMVIFLYAILLLRIVWLAKICSDDFSAYTLLGIFSVFVIQIIINIGASLGVLPLTGITLPFLSYGGSSLITNMGLIAVAESISMGCRKVGR